MFSFKKDREDKKQWRLEYFDTIYKVYDWDKNLAGYFFPNYQITDKENNALKLSSKDLDYDKEIETIDNMNKNRLKVLGGNLMLPLIKLDLLDNEYGIDLDYVVNSLDQNIQRAKKWKQWIQQNQMEFNISGSSVFTSREDRNMLSIVLEIVKPMVLGKEDLLSNLKPTLDRLHNEGLL